MAEANSGALRKGLADFNKCGSHLGQREEHGGMISFPLRPEISKALVMT